MNTNKLNIKKSIALAFAVALLPATPAFAAEGEGTLNLIDRTVGIAVGDLTFGDIARPGSGSAGTLSMACSNSGVASVDYDGGAVNVTTNDDECGTVTVTPAVSGSQDLVVTLNADSSTPFTNGSNTLSTMIRLYNSSGLAFEVNPAGSADGVANITISDATDYYVGAAVSGISNTDTLGVYTATYEITVAGN